MYGIFAKQKKFYQLAQIYTKQTRIDRKLKNDYFSIDLQWVL